MRTQTEVPDRAFYVGGGGSNTVNFGSQDIYGFASSDVFKDGAKISTGSAGGPGKGCQ